MPDTPRHRASPAPRTHRWTRRLVKLLASYALFSLLTWPILSQVTATGYQQQTGRALAFDLAGFNPFTLSVFFYGLSDTNADGSTLWAADAVTINPSLLKSLWHRAWVFDAIELHGLTMAPARLTREQFNFSDILAHRAARQPENPEAASTGEPLTIPRLLINHFSLQAHRLEYTDAARPTPATSGLHDLAFTLTDFSTLDHEGDGYRLLAEGVDGGKLEWQGDLSVPAERTWGQFSVTDIQLKPIWQFLEPDLAFLLESGRLSLSGHYDFNWRQGAHWRLEQGLLVLDQWQASSKDQSRPTHTALDQLRVGVEYLDSAAREAVVSDIQITGLSLSSWHEGNRVGLVEMFTPLNPTTADTANAKGPANETAPAWAWTIRQQLLDSARVRWQVPELNQRELRFDPVNIRLQNLNSGSAPAELQMGMLIDNKARFSAQGQWQTAERNLELTSALDQLPLAWLNPILDDVVTLQVAGGELSSQQTLRLHQGKPEQLVADIRIAALATEGSQNTPLFSFGELSAEQLVIDFHQRRADLERLRIDDLLGSLHIRQDGTTNLNDLVVPSAPDTPTTEVQPTDPTNASAPWQWQLQQLALANATLDFRDDTPLTPFATRIRNFSGAVAPLASDANKAMQVDFKGNVDGYAPVTLKGWAKPLLADPAMDLNLRFAAMDLGVFNPYSTTFTGWQIEKGLLTVELDYALDNKRVRGNNRVILDQLTLGERINSKRLIDLPLRLALALLTDENGVADLAVPVAGTTDDPEFSIGSILWAAVRNSIMKLVTAPFNFLASLVGSDEDLGFIGFEPGDVQITPAAAEKLQNLHQALQQRPTLRLGMVGDVSQNEIRQLKQSALLAIFVERGVDEADAQARNNSWQEAARALLTERNVTLPTPATPESLEAALLASQPLPQAAMQALAESRALGTKQYLLNNLGLAADRVFVHSITLACGEPEHCQGAQVRFEISP